MTEVWAPSLLQFHFLLLISLEADVCQQTTWRYTCLNKSVFQSYLPQQEYFSVLLFTASFRGNWHISAGQPGDVSARDVCLKDFYFTFSLNIHYFTDRRLTRLSLTTWSSARWLNSHTCSLAAWSTSTSITTSGESLSLPVSPHLMSPHLYLYPHTWWVPIFTCVPTSGESPSLPVSPHLVSPHLYLCPYIWWVPIFAYVPTSGEFFSLINVSYLWYVWWVSPSLYHQVWWISASFVWEWLKLSTWAMILYILS